MKQAHHPTINPTSKYPQHNQPWAGEQKMSRHENFKYPYTDIIFSQISWSMVIENRMYSMAACIVIRSVWQTKAQVAKKTGFNQVKHRI